MCLIPILLALTATLSAADLGYTVPLDAKMDNGQPDPRAGMSIRPASSYTDKMYGHWGDKFIGKTSAEAYVFGKSYHSNRSIDWNENNLGLGGGVAYHYDSNTDLTFVGGAYKDSYGDRAQFALIGVRVVGGDRDGAHATIGVNAGYFTGSDFNGFGIMPVLSVGYDRVDLCVTGSPPGSAGNKNSGSRDPHDNYGAASGFIGVFLKIRIATF